MPASPTAKSGTGIHWRAGTYAGAAIGGMFWVVVALVTVVTPRTDQQLHALAPHRLLLACAVSLAFAIVGGVLMRIGRRLVATIGLALIVGPLSGWVIVASVALQRT